MGNGDLQDSKGWKLVASGTGRNISLPLLICSYRMDSGLRQQKRAGQSVQRHIRAGRAPGHPGAPGTVGDTLNQGQQRATAMTEGQESLTHNHCFEALPSGHGSALSRSHLVSSKQLELPQSLRAL